MIPFRLRHRPAQETPGDGAVDWDRLTRLAADAWTWRDLESLDQLADCVRGLRAKVLEEWGD